MYYFATGFSLNINCKTCLHYLMLGPPERIYLFKSEICIFKFFKFWGLPKEFNYSNQGFK